MQFEYPYAFLLLLLYVICSIKCKMRTQSILFPHLKIFSPAISKSSKLMELLRWLAIVMLLVALATPYSSEKIPLKPVQGYSIVLVVDASVSMRAIGFDRSDMNINRFDVVKKVISGFVKSRKSDNIGLVVFADYAYIGAPLTMDKGILSQLIEHLHIGIAGRSTAIFDALAQSTTMFKEPKAKNSIVILLTDGVNSAGNIPYSVAMKLVKREKIKLYTIGVGRKGEYNDILLKQMAQSSGGEFFSASVASQLEKIYSKIDELESSEITPLSYEIKVHYFQYPLFIAFFALLGFVTLFNRRGVA